MQRGSPTLPILLIILIAVTCLPGIAGGVPDSQLPPKPQFNISMIFSLPHLSSELSETAGLGPNRLFADENYWASKGERHRQNLQDWQTRNDPFVGYYRWYEACAAVTAYEIAIEKYQKNPRSSGNDQRISGAYLELANTYEILAQAENNPGYYEYQLEALNQATDAFPTGKDTWDQKIDLLNRLGRTQEAQQAQAEYDRIRQQVERGSSFIERAMTLFEPFDPILGVMAIVISIILIVTRKKIQG